MKIRTGFVSNSSASSFVIATTKENFNKVLEQLTPYQKAVIQEISEETNFLGKEIISVGDLVAGDCSYTFEDFSFNKIEYEYDIDEEAEKDGPRCACYKYKEILKELIPKDEIFNWDMG